MKTLWQFRLSKGNNHTFLSAVYSDNMFYLGLFSGGYFDIASKLPHNWKGNPPGYSTGRVRHLVNLTPDQCLAWKHTCCLPVNDSSYKTAQVCLNLNSMHTFGSDVQCFVCYECLLTHIMCQGHVINVLVCYFPSCITDGKNGEKIGIEMFLYQECMALIFRTQY